MGRTSTSRKRASTLAKPRLPQDLFWHPPPLPPTPLAHQEVWQTNKTVTTNPVAMREAVREHAS